MIRYGERRQPSYAWAFDRGDGLANVGYGELLPTKGDRREPPSRRLLLEQLEVLIPGVAAAGTDWRGHHLPLTSWRWRQPDGPVLLVGDAAGLVNPMTGEGIYYAVATGIIAGRTAARTVRAGRPDHAGAAHRRDVRRLLATHLRHTWLASRLARSPSVVDAGIRAAGRDRHAFDTSSSSVSATAGSHLGSPPGCSAGSSAADRPGVAHCTYLRTCAALRRGRGPFPAHVRRNGARFRSLPCAPAQLTGWVSSASLRACAGIEAGSGRFPAHVRREGAIASPESCAPAQGRRERLAPWLRTCAGKARQRAPGWAGPVPGQGRDAQATHRRAVGRASRRAAGIGSPQRSQVP